MSSLLRKISRMSLAAAFVFGSIAFTDASERERRFFEQIEGRWTGPGEIVAGKYEGTKFVCNLIGTVPEGRVGMALDGGCRVGLFNRDMSAQVVRARSGYRGTFLDGAEGKGLDIVGGAVKGDYVVFSILRNELTGAMRAQITDRDKMSVTISVHVEDELVPVIGVNLTRVDRRSVGAVKRD